MIRAYTLRASTWRALPPVTHQRLASLLRILLEQNKPGCNCSSGQFDEIKLPNLLLTASATGQTGVSSSVIAKNVKQSVNAMWNETNAKATWHLVAPTGSDPQNHRTSANASLRAVGAWTVALSHCDALECAAMSAATTFGERAEAVIISGPRRGEIVKLSGQDLPPGAAEWRKLDQALDKLNAKLAAVSREFRAAAKSLSRSGGGR